MDTQQIKAFITTHHKVITVVCAALIFILVLAYSMKKEGFAYTNEMRDAFRKVRQFKFKIKADFPPTTQAKWEDMASGMNSIRSDLEALFNSVGFEDKTSPAFKNAIQTVLANQQASYNNIKNVADNFASYMEKEAQAQGTLKAILDSAKQTSLKDEKDIKDLIEAAKAEEEAATQAAAAPAPMPSAMPASYLRNKRVGCNP